MPDQTNSIGTIRHKLCKCLINILTAKNDTTSCYDEIDPMFYGFNVKLQLRLLTIWAIIETNTRNKAEFSVRKKSLQESRRTCKGKTQQNGRSAPNCPWLQGLAYFTLKRNPAELRHTIFIFPLYLLLFQGLGSCFFFCLEFYFVCFQTASRVAAERGPPTRQNNRTNTHTDYDQTTYQVCP